MWELRERKRQKERTNNYRSLTKIAEDPTEAQEKILRDPKQVEMYLEYGMFQLKDIDIERIEADKRKSTRVSFYFQIINIYMHSLNINKCLCKN